MNLLPLYKVGNRFFSKAVYQIKIQPGKQVQIS